MGRWRRFLRSASLPLHLHNKYRGNCFFPVLPSYLREDMEKENLALSAECGTAESGKVYNRLKNVPHMTVYRRENIPSRFHYKHGRFVSPLTLVAEEGWFIVESRETLPFWENGTGKREAWQNGWHGYDNELMDMRGVFLAYGPDFKPNFKAAPIRSVDVYNVMCKVAGIEPLPNNGSWSRVECMLKNNANLALSLQWSSFVLALILFPLFV
ncbi:hypothetical protein lerEdw1_012119 [Lerista edwardsae]|nr:hypothetical protein lerEdw1_012119 [Lerista edwardsae]